MAKGVKKVVAFALPIIGSAFGPIGAAVGGAVGGAMNGGGVKGALLGGVTGYASAGLGSQLLGTSASTLPAGAQGPVSYGSGIRGLFSGGGVNALKNTATSLTSEALDPTRLLLTAGSGLMAQEGAKTSKDAAKIQSQSIDRAISAATNASAPYTQLGADSVAKLNSINADPAGYIKNNPMYTTLAKDAERRLLTNAAARGKVGSGGTASALQDQLLMLGNNLMQTDVNNLQTNINTGAAAASGVGANTANLLAAQGDVNAAGKVGEFNNYNSGYQNYLNTLLALRSTNQQAQPIRG